MGETEQIIFEVISAAGDAKNYSMQAINYASAGEKNKANETLQSAAKALKKGSLAHFKLITGESGKNVEFSVLLMHAEDQLMAAETFRDLATKLVETNLKLANLIK